MHSLTIAPKVSVVLPTYNRLRFLQSAVESVRAQSLQDWELLIADDGSGPETRAYLEDLRSPKIRVLFLDHCANPSRVRNFAIGHVRGEFVALIDSDDAWAPTKLEKQVKALTENPRADWCYTLEKMIDEHGNPWTRTRIPTFQPQDGWVFEQLLRLDLCMSMPTIMARSTAIKRIHGFDESLRFAEWHDLCLRLARIGEVIAVREVLCDVRTHSEHYSSNPVDSQKGWLQLYDKMSRLVEEPNLKRVCEAGYARTSLRLSWGLQQRFGYRAGIVGLIRALPKSARFLWWWLGVLKRIASPLDPRRVLRRR